MIDITQSLNPTSKHKPTIMLGIFLLTAIFSFGMAQQVFADYPIHVGSIFDDGFTGVNNEIALHSPSSIYVIGNYAYVASHTDDGVEIIDISNPANPIHVGAIFDDETTALNAASGIYVVGNYAYVASQTDHGVAIIDISDPTNPTHAGSIFDDETTALEGAIGIFVLGNYAYVTSFVDQGVAIIDISNPENPIHVGSIFDNITTALDGAAIIYVLDNYAYVASYYDDGVEIIDISNPANPIHVGAIFDDETTALEGAASIYVVGDYAYVASQIDHGVEILDISNPANPIHVGAIFDDNTTALKGAASIYVRGNYAYVGSLEDNGVAIIDISDPTNPTHAGSIFDDETTALTGVNGIFVLGNYAYVAGFFDNGVEILQISGPIDNKDSSSSSSSSCTDCIPPTFGLNKDYVLVVENGFTYNGKSVDVTGYYTSFPLITVVTNQTNTVTVKVYENSGFNSIDLIQFGLGMPKVGSPLNDAQVLLEFWIDNTVITEIIKTNNNNLVDVLNATTSLVGCTSDIGEDCLELSVEYIYRDQPKYNIMAINGVDFSRNTWTNYMNEGVEVIGDSLNEPQTQQVIVSKGGVFYPQTSGETTLTLTDYKKDIWTDEYGYTWSTNNYGPYLVDEIPPPEKRDDYISPWTGVNDRVHSDFEAYKKLQVDKAIQIIEENYYH